MRILLATRNYRLAADLDHGYADVEIVTVASSYVDAVESANEAAERGEPIDVAIVDERLGSTSDLDAGVDLGTVVEQLKAASMSARIIVSTPSVAPIPAATDKGAELFVEHDSDNAATNLAAKLNLMPKSEAARIIAVVGLEGGAGRSHVAANLASSLAETLPRHAEEGVLLWEGDIKHASYAYTIGSFDPDLTERGRRTISRLINSDLSNPGIAEIKNAIINRERISHLGYDLLLAPYGIREVLGLYQSYGNLYNLSQRLRTILDVTRRHYKAVVVDTGTDFISDPMPAMALAEADQIVLVATPTPSGLANVRNMREVLSDLHALGHTKLVVNRVAGSNVDNGTYLKLIEEEQRNGLPIALKVRDANADTKVWNELAQMVMPSQSR